MNNVFVLADYRKKIERPKDEKLPVETFVDTGHYHLEAIKKEKK